VVITEPGWAVIGLITLPPFVLKVIVTLAIEEDEEGVVETQQEEAKQDLERRRGEIE
jgi:hypothetical protein